MDNPSSAPEWVAGTQVLLDSWEHHLGKPLIERQSPESDSKTLFEVPFVVVAHGTEADPILNYANLAAVQLWEMPLQELLKTPSRKTAEPVHRDERSELLRRTTENGFIDDYSGIRISSTGRRFRIHQATVWNLIDCDGKLVGQAAAFSQWTNLPSE